MPLISYTKDIPDGPHNPSNDQPDMKDNNNHIDDIISIDHYSFNVGTNNSGTHKQVTLTNEAPPGFAGGNSVIFANLQGGLSVPWVQNSSFTLPIMSHVIPVGATNGVTSVLGAIILQWGVVIGPFGSNTSGTTLFNIAFSNNLFSIFLTLTSSGATNQKNTIYVQDGTQNLTGFDWRIVRDSTVPSFYWFAIGN